ncbi:MAG: DUF433 domain-containing protein [Gammaproteobacteria bacterium]|nr:DUF433 domain-containing protein [Gammaproteobacteria bacterium]
MSGTPCFRGTRLPVQQLFEWLADGVPLDEFDRDFKLDPRAAAAVLQIGSAAVKAAAAQTPPAPTSPDDCFHEGGGEVRDCMNIA